MDAQGPRQASNRCRVGRRGEARTQWITSLDHVRLAVLETSGPISYMSTER